MTTQQQFAQKVALLIKSSRALTPQARKLIAELLQEARAKIVGELSNLDPNTFHAAQLQQLKVSIDAAMRDFAAQAIAAVNKMQETGFGLGAATVQQPVAAVTGLDPLLGGISRSALTIAQGYTADLISGLSADAAAKVNGAIQRAFLGGQPLDNIIAQIGRAIGGDKFTGIFSAIGERAQAIAINEVLRVHSIAAQARLEDLQARHPDLKKEWRHIHAARVPRATHLAADGQVAPVAEPFLVGGEELMYPRDPAGSAENTINCHCLLQPYFDEDALQPTPGQKGLLQSLGIEITAGPA